MVDLTKAFTGLSEGTKAAIEDLLQLICRAGEFQVEHHDMLSAWRKAAIRRGECRGPERQL